MPSTTTSGSLRSSTLDGPRIHSRGAAPTLPPDSSTFSPASTVTELIRGRAAGLNVLESGGSVGAAPRLWIRGPSSVLLRNDPLVVVDGIRVISHPAALTINVGGAGTSRLEDIDPGDVQGVRVLRGPAATAVYGPEAAAGVLEITTRTGRGQGPRFHAWTGLGARDDVAEYPANFTRLGSSGTCTLQLQARGSCPGDGTLLSFNPLEQASPFRTGRSVTAGLAVRGSQPSGGLSWALSGGMENADGVLATSEREMRSLRANAGWTGSRVRLAFHGAHVRRETALPFGDQSQFGRIAAGLEGFAVDDDVRRGYRTLPPEDDFYFNRESVRHTTLGASARWRSPLEWLALDLYASRDAADADEVTALTRGIPGNTGTFRRDVALERARSTAGARLNAEQRIRSFRGTASLGLERLGRTLDRVQQDSGAVRQTLRDEQSDVGAYLAGVLRWRHGLAFSGAVRRDEPSRTRQPQWSYSAGGEWELSRGRWFPAQPWIGGLRLRAAYGETARGVEALSALPPGPCAGACPARPRPETLAEREGGIDVELFRRALSVGVTAYRRETRHLIGTVPQAAGFRSMGSLHNDGVEVQAALRGGRAGFVAWEIEASGARNRNRVEADEDGFIPGSGVFATANRHGRPLGSYYFRPVLRAEDRDGDGIIEVCTGTSVCEVQLGTEEEFLGSSLPERLGAVAGTVRLGGMLSLYARADYAGGARLLDLTNNLRCATRQNCRADYDPATPMDEQARVVAALQGSRAGFVHDADFVRLREVAVTLSAPRGWARRFGASGVELTVGGRNLAIWTDYPGVDPEVNSAGPEVTAAFDMHPQAPVRTWTTRVDVRF
ncbi:MAG TPA: TonB-dependent receptor [Longimicrobium sp.]|nr:TonB-dependent receptor [Longimicrobium sp.]